MTTPGYPLLGFGALAGGTKTWPRSVAPLRPLNATGATRPRPASVQRLIVRNGSADFEPGTSVVKPPRGCDGSPAWSAICSAYSAAPCVRLPKPKAGLASWSRLRRPAQYWFFVSRATHSGVPGAGSPAGATQLMSTPNGGAAVAGAAPSAAAATHIPVKTEPRSRMPLERIRTGRLAGIGGSLAGWTHARGLTPSVHPNVAQGRGYAATVAPSSRSRTSWVHGPSVLMASAQVQPDISEIAPPWTANSWPPIVQSARAR